LVEAARTGWPAAVEEPALTEDADRRRDREMLINTVVTGLPGIYLSSGSVTVNALTAAALIAVAVSRRS
jgi:hypothetical protein